MSKREKFVFFYSLPASVRREKRPVVWNHYTITNLCNLITGNEFSLGAVGADMEIKVESGLAIDRKRRAEF